MLDLLRNGAAFVLVLGTLVFIHELGHYLAARWRGVHIEVFSIGFGPRITGWTDRVGTEWKLCWLPLGGYVKLHGQERPEDASPEARAAWMAGRTFHEKGVGSRAIVVAAGPFANFLLAAVLLAVLSYAMGEAVPNETSRLGTVDPAGAAAKAGLVAGDRVEAIDGTAVDTFTRLREVVSASPGRTVEMRVAGAGGNRTVPVTLGTAPGPGGTPIGTLGVRSAVDHVPVGPLDAVGTGLRATWSITASTLQGLGQMISGRRGTEELSGPLGIAKLSGQVAQLGFASLVSFIAVLSVNLALINLFPIPVLDGGHLLFYAAEAVRGRPLSARVQEFGFRAGFALLASLFVFATWNDLSNMGLFRWVGRLIG